MYLKIESKLINSSFALVSHVFSLYCQPITKYTMAIIIVILTLNFSPNIYTL